jgi:hypothetical protein
MASPPTMCYETRLHLADTSLVMYFGVYSQAGVLSGTSLVMI